MTPIEYLRNREDELIKVGEQLDEQCTWIRGFIIKHDNGSSTFGVCNFAADIRDDYVIEAIAITANVDPENVELCCAYELIDDQYEGIAYLTTEVQV